MTLQDILIHGLAAYVATLVVAKSHAMEWFRQLFRAAAGLLPYEMAGHFTRLYGGHACTQDDDQFPDGADSPSGFDMISCRMCVGFWVSLVLCLPVSFSFVDLLAVYGVAYALTTWEKPAYG